MIAPTTLLFDWHGTLVDTQDAMFAAMEDMLPQLESLGLVSELRDEVECSNLADARLLRYIRVYRRLHPRILAERRNSRTEIFAIIFGNNRAAKQIAHDAYNRCYRDHVGKVQPFQQGITEYLGLFREAGFRLGVVTNRSREFLEYELDHVADGQWRELFDVTVCADDVAHYKPDPEMLLRAVERLGQLPSEDIWYVADSFVDMEAAKQAGISGLFYNGGHWDAAQLKLALAAHPPLGIVGSFGDLLQRLEADHPPLAALITQRGRPDYPAPVPPPPRQEPDWHPALARLTPPEAILFDWHATLVDTLDAMYHAVDELLPELGFLGLQQRLVDPAQCRSPEDAKLVEYVQSRGRLHPRIRADRKISRTDIFEVLFGADDEAKRIAHGAFNRHYRKHFGEVLPFEPQVCDLLRGLRALPMDLGVITNRDREFFEHELKAVEAGRWTSLFDVEVCGDDTPLRKPHPDQLLRAAEALNRPADRRLWYVGDSTTDIIAAKRAGMTAVFFNGAQWDLPWLNKIFPGSQRQPHRPDVVVNDFSEFWALVLACGDRRGN